MPRLGALLELSREHHAALVLARDCERVSADTLTNLLQRIHAHHRDTLIAHFAEEERLMALAADTVPADMAERFHVDHTWLREWVTTPDPDVAAVIAYGQRIGAHVRFEERELWPFLQDVASNLDDTGAG